MTIRDLLAMTSGLHDYDDDPAYVRAFARAPRAVRGLHRLAEFGLSRARLFAPGTPRRTFYSNTNYALLAMVVEAITGRRYPARLARLLRRAGMRHTTYPRGAASTAGRGELIRGYAPPFGTGAPQLVRGYRRAFASAPSSTVPVDPLAVQAVASDPLASGPTVAVGPAPASEEERYGGPSEVRRLNLTSAYSVRGTGASAGAVLSNTQDLVRFWRALFRGPPPRRARTEVDASIGPRPPNPSGVRNYYGLGLLRQDVAPGAFWPGSPRLRIWNKLGDIWGYTSASYYVSGPAPYGGVVVTNTTNLFPSPVGDLGVLRDTLRALADPSA